MKSFKSFITESERPLKLKRSGKGRYSATSTFVFKGVPKPVDIDVYETDKKGMWSYTVTVSNDPAISYYAGDHMKLSEVRMYLGREHDYGLVYSQGVWSMDSAQWRSKVKVQ